jgi:hypothetical protein
MAKQELDRRTGMPKRQQAMPVVPPQKGATEKPSPKSGANGKLAKVRELLEQALDALHAE